MYPDKSLNGTKWASGLALSDGDYAQLQAITHARGRKPDVISMTLSPQNWGDYSSPASKTGLAQLGKSAARKSLTVPVLPVAGGEATTAAKGGYAAEWEEFGRALVASGNGESIVRINADKMGGSLSDRAAAWRFAARQIKSSAPKVVLEWPVPNSIPEKDWEALFPSPDLVDLIGIDITRTGQPWVMQMNAESGISQKFQWASRKGKAVAVHWTLGSDGAETGADAWVQNVHDLLARKAQEGVLAYETYSETRALSRSKGAQMYRQLF